MENGVSGLWTLLLPLGILLGWIIGRWNKANNSPTNNLSPEYFIGLNYLLNEQPDKAVDIFIKLLEVDSDTYETHLALGSLFRRRGEVDRSIRVHQNLIARPQLSQEQKLEALLELGRDYMCAGVLDRSERIFQEVVEFSALDSPTALKYLLDIYQQEKFWQKSIHVAKMLERATSRSMHDVIANHYCELVEEALREQRIDQSKVYLKRAYVTDPNSVRASLLQASIETRQGKYKSAIKTYKKIKYQDPDFLSEVIPLIVVCFQSINSQDECMEFLQETIRQYPRISIALAVAEIFKTSISTEQAIDFMADHLSTNPSVRGLNRLIEWHINTSYGKVRSKLKVLKDITTNLLKHKPKYRCHHCGFSGNKIHWLCPSCKRWNSVKPVQGIEGD